MLTFGPKLNRSYTFYIPFMSMNIEISVLFHKCNSCLGFNTDQRIFQMHRDGEVTSYIYKNLEESVFATTFLELKSFTSKNLDIKYQFNDILPQFKNEVIYKSNETVKVSKVNTINGDFESNLYVYVFGFQSYGDDFLFFLAERQHIDVSLSKKISRGVGLMLSSKNRMDDFLQTVDYHNSSMIKPKSVDESLQNIFSNKPNISTRRI